MIRILVYIVSIIVAAWLLSILLGITGFTVIEFGNTRVDVATGVLLTLVVMAVFLFFFGGTAMAWLFGLPGKFKRRGEDRRRQRGMTALTRGLEAVAAGDAADAQRYAKSAAKALQEPALTRLLTAQAAQLAGDRLTAEQSYTAMLDAPETEFLGLRGLYLHAVQTGDDDEARAYAERAFALRPGTAWAFESVLKLHLEQAAWGDALEAIALARQNQLAEGIEFRRMDAAIRTARAYASSEAGERDDALKDAEAALKKAPGLTPAAALAAQEHQAAGHKSKAARLLGDAFEAAPHPGLAAVMRRVFDHERAERVEGRLVKMAERAPDHPEARLLLAESQLAAAEAEAAQETISPLLTGRPGRRVLDLMAAITEARYGAPAAAPWHARAAQAPQEFIPGRDGQFHYTTEGWRRLIREYAEHGRLAPPPLEVETPELGADEVRALLMPPAPDEVLPATGATEDGSDLAEIGADDEKKSPEDRNEESGEDSAPKKPSADLVNLDKKLQSSA